MNAKQFKEKEQDIAKDKIMQAAIQLFAEHGYDGTTVRDIVEKAGVNLSLVSYHFEGKEKLYLECLRMWGKARSEIAFRMLEPAKTAEEFEIKFQMACHEMMNAMIQNRDLAVIVNREIESDLPVAREIWENYFLPMFKAFEDFIHEAQKKKFISNQFAPVHYAHLVHASIMNSFKWDHLSKKYYKRSIENKKERDECVEFLVSTILSGCKKT